MITLAATAVGLALAGGGLAVLWARRHQATGASTIALVATRYLGGKRYLTLVEVDGQRLLLGLSEERVSLVARLGATTAGGISTSLEPQA